MKAFLLCAGLGTRLKDAEPLVPKVMVPLEHKPLLQHNIEFLKKEGVTDLLINLHYRGDQITSFFGDGAAFGVRIVYSHEPTLLGTAGAVKKVADLLKETFVVVYGDNLVRVDLRALVEAHLAARAAVTIGLARADDPWTRGVVRTDPRGWVTSFVEKPPRSAMGESALINAGVLVVEPTVVNEIPDGVPYDFGSDLLPRLLIRGWPIYGYALSGYVEDIGTPQRLDRVRKDLATQHDEVPG